MKYPETLNAGPLHTLVSELKSSCNRYANGECHTFECLQRGGYLRSENPDYSKATCERHEQAAALETLLANNDSATPFLDAVQEIRTLRDDAVSKTTRLLESRGWRYTSQTPGCVWMFEKQIDGRIVLTDSETALRHELENTDEQYEDLGG